MQTYMEQVEKWRLAAKRLLDTCYPCDSVDSYLLQACDLIDHLDARLAETVADCVRVNDYWEKAEARLAAAEKVCEAVFQVRDHPLIRSTMRDTEMKRANGSLWIDWKRAFDAHDVWQAAKGEK